MVKGGMLKDDADWAKLGIKPGQKLMMMGSAGGQCIAARYPDTNNAASGPHVQAPSVQRGAPCHSLSPIAAVRCVQLGLGPQSRSARRQQAAIMRSNAGSVRRCRPVGQWQIVLTTAVSIVSICSRNSKFCPVEPAHPVTQSSP